MEYTNPDNSISQETQIGIQVKKRKYLLIIGGGAIGILLIGIIGYFSLKYYISYQRDQLRKNIPPVAKSEPDKTGPKVSQTTPVIHNSNPTSDSPQADDGSGIVSSATGTPTPTHATVATPKPSQANQPAAESSNTHYDMNVLVLKYFPLTDDGKNIDMHITGDVGNTYDSIRRKTIDITNNLKTDLAKASTYLGYKNAADGPALNYSIIDTKEFTKAVPIILDDSRRPDYKKLLTDINVCTYVQGKNVSEIWIWAYQGPNYPGSSNPYLAISESKMAGPYGDISNSSRENNIPKCTKTYRVYTFNYSQGTADAVRTWGYQLETELSAVDQHLFRDLWQGAPYSQVSKQNGRCGSVDNPPNARKLYDWSNTIPQQSDCMEWNPDNLGNLSAVNCELWGCDSNSDTDNSQLNYMIWNWQNLPGRNNGKTYQGVNLRNWWDVHGNFDDVVGKGKGLTL